MDGGATTTLYRAVGPTELERIRAARSRAFPKRVHHDPVFAMAASEDLAKRIAREWNAEGRVGYVLRFEVDAGWCRAHLSADAGDRGERWIPAEGLRDLNAHLVGDIRLVATLRPPPPTRPR